MWSRPSLGHFTPGKETRAHCIGGWVGPQGRSGRVRKISPTGFRPLDLPTHSESLFRATWNKYSEEKKIITWGLRKIILKHITVSSPNVTIFSYGENSFKVLINLKINIVCIILFMAEQPLVGQGIFCTVLSVKLNGIGVRHLDLHKLVWY